MTREVVGLDPPPVPAARGAVEFDLGELKPPGDRWDDASQPPAPAAGLLRRLRRWPPRPGVAGTLVLAVAALAVVAGWHLGAQRTESALAEQSAAHPAVFAWVVDGGPTLSSAPDDPRVTVELHVANLSPDPLLIRSVAITTDHHDATVQWHGYTAAPIAPEDNTIAELVARPSCTSSYEGAFLSVVVVRMAVDGTRRPIRVSAGADGRIGDQLGAILNRVCAYPTRDDPESGVDGLVIDQSTGADGATLTITNNGSGPREVRIQSDSNPAFQLISSVPDAREIQPRQSLTVHLRVRITDCTAVVGLREWAASVVLQVTRQSESPQITGTAEIQTGFGVPDLMLVPGGAAIQRTCPS